MSFLLLLLSLWLGMLGANLSQSSAADTTDDGSSEGGSASSLANARLDTQLKSDVGRFMAMGETYAGNNNGNYPETLEEMYGSYIDKEDIPNPVTQSSYIETISEPAEGEIQYVLGAECASEAGPVVATDSRRRYAASVQLTNGDFYCIDNS